VYPFEELSKLENLSKKHDSSLFAFGNHSKKRPNNLVLGRMYDFKVLDMFELEIEEFKAMQDFTITEIEKDQKPLMLF
jgi:ribosome production factor 2